MSAMEVFDYEVAPVENLSETTLQVTKEAYAQRPGLSDLANRGNDDSVIEFVGEVQILQQDGAAPTESDSDDTVISFPAKGDVELKRNVELVAFGQDGIQVESVEVIDLEAGLSVKHFSHVAESHFRQQKARGCSLGPEHKPLGEAMSEIQNSTDFESQLDALKIITLTDGEIWSARDLMPYAGYKAWQDWSRAISRAIESVNASGLDASEHFRGAPKTSPMPNGGTKQIEDVEITRYGAYILFQNGDPRKPEIAASQQYFAVQTRKQETAAVGLSDDEIIVRALTIATGRVNALEAKVTELEPKAAHADTLRKSDGLQLIGDVANQLKIHAQANFPDLTVKQSDVFDLAGIVGLVIRGNTVRNNQPTARAIEAGWVKPADVTFETNNHGTRTKYYARLTHKGAGRLWDAAVNNLKTYGQVLAPKKELAA